MKRVIYSAVYGPATSEIRPVLDPQPGWDYILIAAPDAQITAPAPWQVVRQPAISRNWRVAAKQFKILPHLFLQKYDVSVYIDANISLRERASDWLERYSSADIGMACFRHNKHSTVVAEWLYVLMYGKESLRPWLRVLSLLHRHGTFFRPVIQGGLLLRHHHRPDVVAAMTRWWDLISTYSERDQALWSLAEGHLTDGYRVLPGALHDSEGTYLEPHANRRFDANGVEMTSLHTRVLRVYRDLRLGRRIH